MNESGLMFSKQLKMLIEKKGTNKNQVAVATGISSGLITEYVQGKKTPSENLVKLADYFGVSTNYLLGRIEEDYMKVDAKATNIGIAVNSGKVETFNMNGSSVPTGQKEDLCRIFDMLDKVKQNEMMGLAYKLEEAVRSELRRVVLSDIKHLGYILISSLKEPNLCDSSTKGHTRLAYFAVLESLYYERILDKEEIENDVRYFPTDAGREYIERTEIFNF